MVSTFEQHRERLETTRENRFDSESTSRGILYGKSLSTNEKVPNDRPPDI